MLSVDCWKNSNNGGSWWWWTLLNSVTAPTVLSLWKPQQNCTNIGNVAPSRILSLCPIQQSLWNKTTHCELFCALDGRIPRIWWWCQNANPECILDCQRNHWHTKSKHGKKRCNSEYLLAVSFPKPHLQVREKLVQRFLQLILNHY